MNEFLNTHWSEKGDFVMNLVEKALTFAAAAHDGMKRKGSALPYIIHPAECVAIAASLTDNPEILAAAALHDTLEDTAVTREDLEREFGPAVTALVCSDSEDKMPHLPPASSWKQRKQATIQALQTASREEKIVAMADKLSNLRSMHTDHEAIGDALWDRFNQKDKRMHEWYYRGVLSQLKELEDTCAYQEYRRLLEEVFGS